LWAVFDNKKIKTMRIKSRFHIRFFSVGSDALAWCSLCLICLGVLLMAVGYVFDFTNHNWYLFLNLFFVIAGAIGYVAAEKKE
jgi:hypothetical protein